MTDYHPSEFILAVAEAMHEADNYFVSYDQARAAANFVLEKAAEVCDAIAVDNFTKLGREHALWMQATAEDCAAGILALKE